MPKFERGNTAGRSSRWQPGQSGNPGGLPPIVRGVRLLAAQRAPRAIHRLSELVESTDERVALAAAVALLDRAGITPLEIEVRLGSRMPLLDNPIDPVPELEEAEVLRLSRVRATNAPGTIDDQSAGPGMIEPDQQASASL